VGEQSRRVGEAIRKRIELAAKALVLEIDKNLRKATPVDTGHARANWVPAVGAPHRAQASAVKVASTIGSSEHAAGVQHVLAYKLEQGALFVSNNVPYIRSLNYGHSQQAPAGFIEFAVDQALQTLRADLAKHLDIDGMRSANTASAFATLDKVGGFGAQGAENLAEAYSPFGDDD
jgi:hypothetical protein